MELATSRRYSYIGAIREVVPNVAIEKFMAKAAYIGRVVFGFKDSTFLELPSSLEEELREGFEPVRQGIGLAAITIYPANKLHYTHFERLTKPEEGLNRVMSKTYARVTAADSRQEEMLRLQLRHIRERFEIEDDSRLVLHANDIAVSTKPQYQHLGEEYALRLTDGPVAQALVEYNHAIFQYVRSTGPGSELCKGQHSSEDLLIPFARLPRDAEDSQRGEFESRIVDDLFKQPLPVAVGPVEWESRGR